MKEIWISNQHLADLYKNGSIVCKLRTDIQSMGETLLVEAEWEVSAYICELKNKIRELEAKMEQMK